MCPLLALLPFPHTMALYAGAPSICMKGPGGTSSFPNNFLLKSLLSCRRCIHLLTIFIVESMLISCHPPCSPCASSTKQNPSFLSVSTRFLRTFLFLFQPSTMFNVIQRQFSWKTSIHRRYVILCRIGIGEKSCIDWIVLVFEEGCGSKCCT